MMTNPELSNVQTLAWAYHLKGRGDAVEEYLNRYCDFEPAETAAIFEAAGLGFGAHRLNGDDEGYRAKLDWDALGHALSMRDCIKDRSERLELIQDAIQSLQAKKVTPTFDKVVEHIRSHRASRITLESNPETYHESYASMKRDLLTIVNMQGMSASLWPEDIKKFFGVDEVTFETNFKKLAFDLRAEHDIDAKALPITDSNGNETGVKYTFELTY